MRKAAVIFVQARDLDVRPGEPLVIVISDWQDVTLADHHKTSRADQSTVHHPAAPFWTWFIENPRPASSVSP